VELEAVQASLFSSVVTMSLGPPPRRPAQETDTAASERADFRLSELVSVPRRVPNVCVVASGGHRDSSSSYGDLPSGYPGAYLAAEREPPSSIIERNLSLAARALAPVTLDSGFPQECLGSAANVALQRSNSSAEVALVDSSIAD